MSHANIAITKGLSTKVSISDFDRVTRYKWHAKASGSGDGNNYYAYGWVDGVHIPLHHFILGAGKGSRVDHKNGDRLDNRRENLRFATHSQNIANQTSRPNRTGFRGVKFQYGKFKAQIGKPGVCGEKIHLGTFETAEQAARAYDQAAFARWGEFARLNFP